MASLFPRALGLAVIVGLAILARVTISGAAVSSTGDIRHGAYLVQSIGQCGDCHGANLEGQPLPFKPTIHMPWAARSPKIAGLPMFSNDAAAERFLRTGIDQHGHHARPPMPPYHLNASDARDVVAYLRGVH